MTKHGTKGLLVLLFLAGCQAQLGNGEYHGHGRQEMRASPEDIMGGAWTTQGEWLVSPALDAPDGATRVGLLIAQSEPGLMPSVQTRALSDGVPVGDWVDVHETWAEEDHHVGIAELGTIADGAQIRIASVDATIVQQLTWNAVIPDDEALVEPEPSSDLGASRESLRSELGGLGIVTRESWGARATRCTAANASKSRMAIHYTVTPSSNPERQVRGIQAYHMDSRGWCDVGYHFLVGIDGSIYEGRPLHLLGAHVGGNNTGNIGISFIGCFHSSSCGGMGPTTPPEVMIDAGGRLLGELSDIYGIALDGTHVKGHRDHSGASTSCPGDYLYRRIGDMLAIGRDGSGIAPPAPPPEPTPTPTPSPSPAPTGASCSHSYGGTYGDTACSAGYQCCDGRWRVRGSSSACGACACVEESGSVGCSAGSATPTPAPSPTPPPGASCGHSYGGTYANTACSAGYQCCDGRWRVRGSSSACGACFCVEETGTSGCGT